MSPGINNIFATLIDWVRDTKSDLAVAALGICKDTDDVSNPS